MIFNVVEIVVSLRVYIDIYWMNDLQPIRRNGESFVAKQVENLSLIYD